MGPITYDNIIQFLTSHHEVELRERENSHCQLWWTFHFLFRSFSNATFCDKLPGRFKTSKYGQDPFQYPPTDIYQIDWSLEKRNVHNQALPDGGLSICVENKTIYQSMIDVHQNLAEGIAAHRLHSSFTPSPQLF